MTNSGDYSFRMERTSYKSHDLIYEEPGHRLVVYLEMSGIRQFDWVGCDTELRKGNEPAGDPIPPDKQAEVLRRLTEWSRGRRIRIGIGLPVDMDAFFAEQERAGCSVERRADGTVAVYPPVPRLLGTSGRPDQDSVEDVGLLDNATSHAERMAALLADDSEWCDLPRM